MTHAKRALLVVIAALALVTAQGCGAIDQNPADDSGTADGAAGPAEDGGADSGGDGGTATDGSTPESGETGRMVGMTAAHNKYRAMVQTDTPLPDLTWTPEIATVAQAYSEKLAAGGCNLVHSHGAYGENLYWQSGMQVTPEDVVKSWYDEVACYTLGAFMQGDKCDQTCISAMNSNGCGHYTQVVWRNTLRLGCGMATCPGGAEIWTCNYDPPGNWVGQLAY